MNQKNEIENVAKILEVLTIPLILFAVFYFGCQVVIGQEVIPVAPLPDVAPALPAWQLTIESFIEKLNSPWVAGIVIIIVELLMRFVKTSDPKSLLYVVANGLRLFAKLFEQIAHVLDKYLQRMK